MQEPMWKYPVQNYMVKYVQGLEFSYEQKRTV